MEDKTYRLLINEGIEPIKVSNIKNILSGGASTKKAGLKEAFEFYYALDCCDPEEFVSNIKMILNGK